ncbi:hypothetical protein [Candidatus Mycoplasma mahonii]|uniref:hypothetical protein n=1 Tax=Candidatus Mycoplasma mahonii TaxID=3004105 RepID=UPI0026E9E979|nr:hypothetical protein [Candidatus Mycoplasma mahonii]WKX02669.1 hypothetical protein O3I44_01150 [Candidatus Mycoplasma mahonii]
MDGLHLFKINLKKLFLFENHDPNFPSNTILSNSLKYLWITIRITLCGTTLGYILAFFTSFLSSKIMNKFVAIFNRIIILFIRSFPLIIFVLATQKGFEKEFAAFLIIFWFTWIWSNRYLSDIIENLDFNGYEAWIKKGYSKPYSFNKQVLSRAKNKYIAIFLYSLESNLRWTTMLATVGVIGIGFFISDNIKNHFEFIGIPLLLLFGILIIFEIINTLLNKYLLVVKSKDNEAFNFKKMINYVLILILIFITIYQLAIINYENLFFGNFFSFFGNLKSIDKNMWNTSNPDKNSWLLILQLIYQTIAALTIAIIYAIIASLFSSEKRNKFYVWMPIKFVNNFIKIIPLLVLVYLFNSLFFNPIGLGVVFIGVHTGTTLSNQLTGSINNIDDKIVYEYQKTGFSKLQIIKKLILPTIIKDIKNLSLLRAEGILRNMIILGTIGLSLIGAEISIFQDRSKISEFSSHIWAITITIFTYNLLQIFFKNIKGWKLWKKL